MPLPTNLVEPGANLKGSGLGLAHFYLRHNVAPLSLPPLTDTPPSSQGGGLPPITSPFTKYVQFHSTRQLTLYFAAATPPTHNKRMSTHTHHLSRANYKWKPKAFRFWYDNVIDWMLANPDGNLKQCAEAVGRHPQTIRMIVASDMFKARWAERRGELNGMYNDAILMKTSRVAIQALDALSDRLESNPRGIPAATVADIASKSMEALGFGAPKAGQAMPTQEVHVHVGGDVLASARERMRTIEGQKLAQGRGEPANPNRQIEAASTTIIDGGDK